MKRLTAPFFEFGPKAYIHGQEMLRLARCADSLAVEFGVDIIVSPQTVDLRLIASECHNIKVFSQHMDSLEPGRGIGETLAEALVEAGVAGTLLNHAEKRLTLAELQASIKRARSVGLISLVCVDNPEQATAVAHFSPDAILAESPELIGGGKRSASDGEGIRRTNAVVAEVNPEVQILHGAGINSAEDVYHVIRAGADATGSTSAIIKAPDPLKMLRDMIAAVRRAWDERNAASR